MARPISPKHSTFPALKRAAKDGPPETLRADTPTVPSTVSVVKDYLIVSGIIVLFVLILVALRPVVGVPMNDDFSYARTAEAFASTGHVIYNGWGSPLLFPQMAYGALLIKLFGFSFALLEYSGLVFGALGVLLIFILSRRCGVSQINTALITCLMTLNPIYLGVIPSFMTDVPSMVMLICSILLLLKSLRHDGLETKLDPRWFWLAVALAIISGSNRQVSWVAFIGCLLPLLVWVRASRIQVALGIVAVILSAGALTSWFNKQPGTVPADVSTGLTLFVAYTNVAFMFIYRFLNVLGIFAFPIVLLAMRRKDWLSWSFPVLAILCLVPVFYPLGTRVILWGDDLRLTVWGQYFTSAGAVVGGPFGFHLRPEMLPPFVVRCMVIAGAISIAAIIHLCGVGVKALREEEDPARRHALRCTAIVLSAAMIQLAISLPWFAMMNIFDRYLLFYLPFVLIFLGSMASRRVVSRQVYALPIVLIGLIAFLGFCFTYEYIGMTRARKTLYQNLVKSGVPPQQIDGGFEFNADLQVRLEKYINNERMLNPKFREGAVAKYVPLSPEHFPVIDARYMLTTVEDPDVDWSVESTPVRQIEYRSILGDTRRKMYVYRVVR